MAKRHSLSSGGPPARSNLVLGTCGRPISKAHMKMADYRSHDVPSPIDLRTEKDAREWAASAMSRRPWRAVFFQRFVEELRSLDVRPLQILELGSGPGFLARCILDAIPAAYSMLGFSMHNLACEQLRRTWGEFDSCSWT